ncbi:MAG: hypothetical protein P3A28_09830 [Gemmatimonadota bacterium]|nr:hypothetical protein [Gemmatimonadota bacterium]
MLGVYLLFAVVGLGLLAFSLGDDADASSHDVGGSSGHGASGHGDAAHSHPGDLVLGFFRPRNMIFFAAAFGTTGAIFTWLGRAALSTGVLALLMGAGAMAVSHALFRWLRNTESAVEVVGDAALEGSTGRVAIDVEPGARGRVVCNVGGREVSVLARLAPGTAGTLGAGSEVVVIRMVDGEAEVAPFGSTE